MSVGGVAVPLRAGPFARAAYLLRRIPSFRAHRASHNMRGPCGILASSNWHLVQHVPTASFAISSRLPLSQRPALERLLFFSGQQYKVRHRIVASIESFGAPEIVADDGTLRVRLSGRHDAQTLFAVSGTSAASPVGAISYVRDRLDRLVIVHVAVDQAWSAEGRYADAHLLLRLLHAVRRIAEVTSGVTHVDFFYADGMARTIKIARVRRDESGVQNQGGGVT